MLETQLVSHVMHENDLITPRNKLGTLFIIFEEPTLSSLKD